MRILESDELAQLVWAIDPQYSALVIAAASTGCRFNELAALRLEHLDMVRRHLIVAEELSAARGQLGPIPSRAPRQIPLPRELIEDLRKHFALWPPGPAGYLFTAPRGGLLRHSNFRARVWLPALTVSVGRQLRFEDLRHTHAATLLGVGEHPRVVQLRLGHRSLRDTIDAYGHLIGDSESRPHDPDYLKAFGAYLERRATSYSPAKAHSGPRSATHAATPLGVAFALDGEGAR